MVPTRTDLFRQRHVVRVVVRCAAMLSLAFAAIHGIRSLLVLVLVSDSAAELLLTGCIGYAAVGAYLLVRDRRIAAWLVPAPKAECPACAYPTDSIASDRCPECGHALPLESEPRPDERDAA